MKIIRIKCFCSVRAENEECAIGWNPPGVSAALMLRVNPSAYDDVKGIVPHFERFV